VTYKILFVGLALLLSTLLTGCFSVEIDKVDDEVGGYFDAVESLGKEWKKVINNWEEAANNPDKLPDLSQVADICSSTIVDLLKAWDDITPPEVYKDYHLWMYRAMNYEQEAFSVLVDYYQLGEYADKDDFSRLRNLARELWVLKDKALFMAIEVSGDNEIPEIDAPSPPIYY